MFGTVMNHHLLKQFRYEAQNQTTVWMKGLTMFSEHLHILHHYNSNLNHILVFKYLVIRFLNAKR